MATRKIIDIEQNGEKVWPKGHAKATFMSNGTTVEDAINSIQTGTGGGVVSETDPIFSASPAASITEEKKAEWDSKQAKLVSGTNIKTINGEPILGSGDITIKGGGVSSYITNFTYRELYEVAFSEGKSIECNVQLIEDALRNNIPVFVPIDTTDPSFYGYAVLEGYAEDFLYFSVKTANEIIGVEISRTASEIRSEDINKKGVIAIEEESVSKERIGELDVANIHALYGGRSVYALPDAATGDEDDILLSRDTVKTINGESIIRDDGADDISVAYPIVTTISPAAVLQPNAVTKWNAPISVDLTLSFAEQQVQGYAAEYIARFSVGADGVQLIVPDGVVWADGVLPAMTNGKTYEISFVDNLATFLEF